MIIIELLNNIIAYNIDYYYYYIMIISTNGQVQSEETSL